MRGMPARGGKHGGSFSREGTRRKEDLRGEGNRRVGNGGAGVCGKGRGAPAGVKGRTGKA